MKYFLRRLRSDIQAGRPYLLINLILGVVFLMVIIYPVVFTPDTGRHPLPCVYTSLTGIECSSCGLSRGFSHIVRGQLSEAVELNRHSLPVFLFFAIQLIMRISLSMAYAREIFSARAIVTVDIFVSSGMFLIVFMPLIA